MAITWKKVAYYDDIRGLFEIDISGDLEPVTDVGATDPQYELDVNDDIMPKAAQER